MRRNQPKPAGYHWDVKGHVRQPDGSPSCRWCKGPLAKGRRTYCSDACVEEWVVRAQPARLRAKVFERDKGVCAGCGADTLAWDRQRIEDQLYYSETVARWAERGRPWRGSEFEPRVILDPAGKPYPPEHWITVLAVALRWRVENKVGRYGAVWEADHITPVAEGGEWFDLGNIQSLCVLCHRTKTAAQNRDAARRRRAAAGEMIP